MKILLLFGGRGAEHAVSVRSAASVLSRLSALGHTVLPLGVSRTGALLAPILKDGALPFVWEENATPVTLSSEGNGIRSAFPEGPVTPDLIFSVLHGKDGEDGAWQGLFTLTRTPFVGAGVCASAVGMNKRLSKILAAAVGAPTVPYLAVRAYDDTLPDRVRERLKYPLFVKPTSGGSSVGVSFVERSADLKRAVLLALGEDEEALIEEAILGSELEVGVLEREGSLLISPPAEIRTAGTFYDYDTKYNTKTASFLLPAPLSLWETAFVKQIAASVFRALGCRDMARIDFLKGKDGRIFFNEINTLPGFTEDSLFPRMFAPLGVDPLAFLVEGRE